MASRIDVIANGQVIKSFSVENDLKEITVNVKEGTIGTARWGSGFTWEDNFRDDLDVDTPRIDSLESRVDALEAYIERRKAHNQKVADEMRAWIKEDEENNV